MIIELKILSQSDFHTTLTKYQAPFSPKIEFLHYALQMDIVAINELLDDSVICFGASKKVFLEKLAFIFDHIKLEKDVPYLSQENIGDDAYMLATDNMENEMGFVFMIEEGLDGKIASILHVDESQFTMEENYYDYCDLYFGEDEKLGFIPSKEYTEALFKCTKAYQEIVTDEAVYLSSGDLSTWLIKHKGLLESIKEKKTWLKLNDFRRLYNKLENIFEKRKKYQEVKEVLLSYNPYKSKDLERWVFNYENLYFNHFESFQTLFSEKDEINKTLKFKHQPSVYLKGDDIFSCFEFSRIFKFEYADQQFINNDSINENNYYDVQNLNGYDLARFEIGAQTLNGYFETSPIEDILISKFNFLPVEENSTKPYKCEFIVKNSELLLFLANGTINGNTFYTRNIINCVNDNEFLHLCDFYSGELKFVIGQTKIPLAFKSLTQNKDHLIFTIDKGVIIKIE
jgi:hypothetical protein